MKGSIVDVKGRNSCRPCSLMLTKGKNAPQIVSTIQSELWKGKLSRGRGEINR